MPSIAAPRLIIIVGPTGVGKTRLALNIAESCGGEILSADSMQVYRYMDIGTAKPGKAERTAIPHHLIDIVDPDETFNAALYMQQARKIIGHIGNKKPVIVVGGTGLYIKILLGGILAAPGADAGLRDYYRNLQHRFGKAYLYQLLRKKDDAAARGIEPTDTIRIIRALEVLESTGRSIIDQQREHGFKDRRYQYLKIGIGIERDQLFRILEHRTEDMIERGFVEEVKSLLVRGYHAELKSMQAIGYRHMVNYLSGIQHFEEAVTLMKRDTRRYAKRQATWFAADKEITWFAVQDVPSIRKCVSNYLFHEG